MTTALIGGAMAAKRKARTNTTRIDAEIIRKANVVAAFREISTPDYLATILAPIVERDYKDEIAKRAKGSEQEGR